MSLREPVIANIGECLEELRSAAELWNAADLSRAQQCREMLESVAGKMADAESLLRHAPGNGVAELRPQVLELKTEALRIERLVDASAAFLRVAFPTTGGGSPVYSSGGHIRVERASDASQGLQG